MKYLQFLCLILLGAYTTNTYAQAGVYHTLEDLKAGKLDSMDTYVGNKISSPIPNSFTVRFKKDGKIIGFKPKKICAYQNNEGTIYRVEPPTANTGFRVVAYRLSVWGTVCIYTNPEELRPQKEYIEAPRPDSFLVFMNHNRTVPIALFITDGPAGEISKAKNIEMRAMLSNDPKVGHIWETDDKFSAYISILHYNLNHPISRGYRYRLK